MYMIVCVSIRNMNLLHQIRIHLNRNQTIPHKSRPKFSDAAGERPDQTKNEYIYIEG